MIRTRRPAAAHVVFLAIVVLAGAVSADQRATVSEVSVPGGLRAAQAAVGDEAAPDRAHFLVDLIRRSYDSPILRVDDPRAVRLQALSAALRSGESAAGPFETLPLPLTPDVWIETVFDRQATPATLVRSIADSRGAALFYYGLLSLDDDTRTWIGGQRALIADLVTRYPGAFVAAAPALRMTSSGLRLPGGAAADSTWQALAGRKLGDPGSFVRSFLSLDEGRLASFAGALAQLTPAQAALALGLDSPDASRRIDSARRLYATFLRMAPVRSVEKRTFTRVALDPLFLLAELDAGRGDRPLVPGTRGFWSTVFAESDGRGTLAKEDPRKHPDWRQPADFVWLADQVFRDTESDSRRRYMMVLFAARHLRPGSLDSADGARDAVDAVHASGSHPALSVALERAGIDDLSLFARTMRRASELDGIGDGARQWRALAQFQGALALVTRAAQRHTVSAEEASTLVAALAAIPLTKDDEYDGGIVRWLCGWLQEDAPEEPAARSGAGGPGSLREIVQDGVAGPVEASALRVLAGPPPAVPRVIDWEGTSYHLDFQRAEAVRLTTALGDAPGRPLSSAAAFVRLADALAEGRMPPEMLRLQVRDLSPAGRGEAIDGTPSQFAERHKDVIAGLERAAGAGDVRTAARLAPSLRLLGDDVLAHGLMQFAYATALGARDDVSISAGDAAGRHDFGGRSNLEPAPPWKLPNAGADFGGRWRVRGAVLGLDVALADFSLVRTSTKPLPRKPSVSDADRREFVESVALVDPSRLTDSDRDAIVAAMQNGRARLKLVRTPADVADVADVAGVDALERTLLAWALEHDPGGAASFFSPSQLLWLGLAQTRVEALDAWGTSADSRRGCLCLQFADAWTWERTTGRTTAGMSASAFPDLNLRLAELLSQLHMPAALLAPVLTAATLDLVDLAISRDGDDRRGLVEFVQALRPETVEQYLALLTTGGALVPIEGPAKAGDR